MYAKTENLNRDERIFLRKISDIVNWAKENNRPDIVDHANSYGTIQKPTQLMRAYYALNKMKKEKDVSVSQNQSPNTMNTGQAPSQEEPVSAAQPQSDNQPQAQSTSAPTTSTEDFDPLLQSNVKQRDYTGGMPTGSTVNPTQPVGSIPEPNFNQQSQAGFGAIPPDQKDHRFESVSDLPPNEKAKTSEALSDVIIDFWSTNIPKIMTEIATVSETKLNRMAMKGEINTQLTITVPEVGAMTVKEYFQAIRHQISNSFQVKEEWKMEVKPILTRVLAKKNWGITDEQQLLYMAGSQVVPMVIAALQVRQSNNDVLEQIRIQTQQFHSDGTIPPPASSTPPPPPPPPPAPTPAPEPEILQPEVEEVVAEADHESLHRVATYVEQENSMEPARGTRGERRNVPPDSETQQIPTVNQTLNRP